MFFNDYTYIFPNLVSRAMFGGCAKAKKSQDQDSDSPEDYSDLYGDPFKALPKPEHTNLNLTEDELLRCKRAVQAGRSNDELKSLITRQEFNTLENKLNNKSILNADLLLCLICCLESVDYELFTKLHPFYYKDKSPWFVGD